ncbi:MAG: outer membrane lipoprotein-sorting protein [Spirochaetota bacterium]
MKTGRKGIWIALVFAVLIPQAAAAADMSGLDVMEKVYNRPSGDQMSAELSMLLTNSRGSTRERTIAQFRMDTDGIEKKIMFFTAPADVRDTSFLNWSYEEGRPDDQWIYLPALRRVKRISSSSSGDSFMGSDFTYDDMGERHPSEDRHSIVGRETIDEWDCYIVESVPKGSDEPYSKTRSWVVDGEWFGLKKEYYDDNGEVYKQLTIDEYEKIDGIWVITDMTMENLEKESSTRIRMNDVEFDAGLRESFFTERQMRKGPR